MRERQHSQGGTAHAGNAYAISDTNRDRAKAGRIASGSAEVKQKETENKIAMKTAFFVFIATVILSLFGYHPTQHKSDVIGIQLHDIDSTLAITKAKADTMKAILNQE